LVQTVVVAPLSSSEYDNDDAGFLEEEPYESEEDFLKREVAHLESLEDLLQDLEEEDEAEIDFLVENDSGEDVEELLSLLIDETDKEDDANVFDFVEEDGEYDDDEEDDTAEDDKTDLLVLSGLEQALLQGVVPVSAGVGSDCLPGDWGYDPLDLATKDYIHQAQFLLLQLLPGAERAPMPTARPPALILRDYREAEIRHGRLAMLAAVIWPLQEMLDRLILGEDQFGPLIYDTVTLPYFPLLMTLLMMLLGYLDIYAKAIQDRDDIGDAFLPGDCFWDPLNFIEGAPATMKRNMQERELFNGRVAMLAFAVFVFEEATTHLPLLEIEGNELLFLPAYQVPFIQEWLDAQFG
jgi:light-harvesting complex I chlorophyll a/b binding protein 1